MDTLRYLHGCVESSCNLFARTEGSQLRYVMRWRRSLRFPCCDNFFFFFFHVAPHATDGMSFRPHHRGGWQCAGGAGEHAYKRRVIVQAGNQEIRCDAESCIRNCAREEDEGAARPHQGVGTIAAVVGPLTAQTIGGDPRRLRGGCEVDAGTPGIESAEGEGTRYRGAGWGMRIAEVGRGTAL